MYLIEILDLKEAWVTSFYDIFLCKIKNEDDQILEFNEWRIVQDFEIFKTACGCNQILLCPIQP